MEEYSEFQWEIINNSRDTIFITSLPFALLDSITILPGKVFSQTTTDDGKRKRFSCGQYFKKSTAKVVISGGKILTRELDNGDHWIKSSDYSMCKGEHRCSFKIEQTDIK